MLFFFKKYKCSETCIVANSLGESLDNQVRTSVSVDHILLGSRAIVMDPTRWTLPIPEHL